MASVGTGALCGAYALSRLHERHLIFTPIAATAFFEMCLVAFAQSRLLIVSMLLLLPTAFSLMLLGGSTNVMIQLFSDDRMRGRVLALYVMAFMGMMPWGSLVLGALASRWGGGNAVTIGGSIVMLSAAVAYLGSKRRCQNSEVRSGL